MVPGVPVGDLGWGAFAVLDVVVVDAAWGRGVGVVWCDERSDLELVHHPRVDSGGANALV